MKENIELLVAVDENEYAKGDLYLDDGISIHYKDRNEFNYVTFEYLNGKINIFVNNSMKSLTNKINSIKFYGVKDKKSILISGKKEINENIIKIEKLNYDITVDGVIGKKSVNAGLIVLYVILGVSGACIIGILIFVCIRKRFGDDRSEKIGYDNIP
ncbi:hypothetical protein TVAG_440770 [Trichomonas vaginalis G3]|uniref:Uncharacterized protein n=1 Tax=Trichomonas vaginalis (strain ATCC PRA-98 / G3) TaxID=412133 RepID=A2EX99_TRIV3|nr:glycosyl hydrolase 31 family [Trichomonas vaginalis G3]EAY02698.1 hypothetical protein TVAG_440770 [Trichomonas vaginalis G3]KAI5513594.1 glycosyl hydrolase 31 family [Trichomonas vaginalis G3]|eukprot:XP_001314921.1 hypothetical protein [Trichomonas vaginalis G3]